MILKASLNSCSGDQYVELRFPSTNLLQPRSQAVSKRTEPSLLQSGEERLRFPQVPSSDQLSLESAKISKFKRWIHSNQHPAPQSYKPQQTCKVCVLLPSNMKGMSLSQHWTFWLTSSGPSLFHAGILPPAPPSLQEAPDFLDGIHGWALRTLRCLAMQREWFFPPWHMQVRAPSGQQGRNKMNERITLPFID